MGSSVMTWKQLCRLGRELPEVEEGIWYRTPSLTIRKKSFVRLKEDLATVVFLVESVDEQQFLITTRPAVYFITPHYRDYPAVLAKLSALHVAECRERLRTAWRTKAPRTLVKQFDAREKR